MSYTKDMRYIIVSSHDLEDVDPLLTDDNGFVTHDVYELCREAGRSEHDGIRYMSIIIGWLIDKGWEPVGGVSARIGSQSGAYFVQAMVKR